MKLACVFALLALIPAALTAATPIEPHVLAVALCNGGKVTIPTGPSPRESDGCPSKACHAGCQRKRAARHL